ncbi:MAG TPA: hypothetical protein VIX86_10060 [Streptosporangiaceae bacterium]
MSIDDEQDVRAWLGTALDDFAPGPVPLGVIVRKGKTAVIRRRLTVAYQLSLPPPAPVAPVHYRVTVNPPGPGAARGLIASGRVNGRRWQVSGQRQRLSGQPSICFQAPSGGTCNAGGPPRASRAGVPAYLTNGIGLRPVVSIGTVRDDVTYLQVTLSNGQRLTLHPVAIFGPGYARYVAFAVPASTTVTQISAYAGHAELAYTVPFTARGQVETVSWLRPGAPAGPRPARYLVGSGNADGQRWSEYAYTGPWGVCLVGAGSASMCSPTGIGQLTSGQAARLIMESSGPGGTNFALVAASAVVSHLVVSRADGSTARVPAVPVDGARFAAFTSPPGNKVTHWVAYSAAGRRLASGGVP